MPGAETRTWDGDRGLGMDLSPAEEMGDLESTARQLEKDLKGVRERIEKLKSS
jgi:hypothetical protein